MKLSVLIPTFERPAAINQCLIELGQQQCSESFEILVGIDGPDTPDPVVPAKIAHQTQCVRLDRLGLIGVRRSLMNLAQGKIILWLNDDSHAQPSLLENHLQMHNDETNKVVGGAATWKPIPKPDVFDRLVQDTDLIFFQPKNQREPGKKAPHQTDYRNCFGLNMSFPRQLSEQVGGVAEASESYGYEDIEFVHRMIASGAQAWHTPKATVIHDHRYRPLDVHRREYLLGRAAWNYANLNPQFSIDLFKRDLRNPKELAYMDNALDHERLDAERIERSFLALDGMCPAAINGQMLEYLAEHWVLLKRYLWRLGVSDAAKGTPSQWSLLQNRTL